MMVQDHLMLGWMEHHALREDALQAANNMYMWKSDKLSLNL